MKKNFTLLAAIAIVGVVACNDANKNSSTSDSVVVIPDNSNTTSTTIVRTRVLDNKEVIVLGSNKKLRLRYDTVHYYYVDAATNEQPISYYYDPETKDTFDYRGYNLNNALVFRNGTYSINEEKLMENSYNIEIRDGNKTVITNSNGEETKIKENVNSYKEKTDSSKIKITDRKTKTKIKVPQ